MTSEGSTKADSGAGAGSGPPAVAVTAAGSKAKSTKPVWFYLSDAPPASSSSSSSSSSNASSELDLSALRRGPYFAWEMCALWSSGTVGHATLVWRSKMKDGWTAAGECVPFQSMLQEERATTTHGQEQEQEQRAPVSIAPPSNSLQSIPEGSSSASTPPPPPPPEEEEAAPTSHSSHARASTVNGSHSIPPPPAHPADADADADASTAVASSTTSSAKPVPAVVKSGGVAARLLQLQQLEAQSKSGGLVGAGGVGGGGGGARSKVQAWKDNFGCHEEQKLSGAASASSVDAGSGAGAGAGRAEAAGGARPDAQSFGVVLSPSSATERSVFATVGASTASLPSADAALYGVSSSSAQTRLPLHAASWTGTNGLQCNGSWIASSWGPRGSSVMVVPLDRFDMHFVAAGSAAAASSTPASPAAAASHHQSHLGPSTLVHAHSGPVLDFSFNPFDAQELATGSTDGLVKFWTLPSPRSSASSSSSADRSSTTSSHFRTLSIPSATLTLAKPAHLETLKVHGLMWNPTAADVLAVTLAPLDVIQIFDLSQARVPAASASGLADDSMPSAVKSICHVGASIFHAAWSPSGREIACTAADRLLRIFDVRASAAGLKSGQTSAGPISDSGKASRVAWVDGSADTDSHVLATLSFNRDSARVLSLFDRRALDRGPTTSTVLDAAQTSAPLLFYHAPQRVLVVSGKGDASVKFAELSRDYTRITYLNEYSCRVASGGSGGASNRAHRAMCMGGPRAGAGSTLGAGAAVVGAITPDDLPNLYRMAPLVSSVLPSSSSSASVSASASSGSSGSGSSFVEMIRLRRSDVLHRAIVRRRQTIEAENRYKGSGGEDAEAPRWTAKQFFAQEPHVQAISRAVPALPTIASVIPSAKPAALSAATAMPAAAAVPATASGASSTAFDLLVSELLPRLRDPAASDEFRAAALTAFSAALPSSASRGASADDLLHLRALLSPDRDGSGSVAPHASGGTQSASVSALEERVAEYEQMLGAASLAQKRHMATIASLERGLADATAGKGNKESSKKEKEKEKEKERANHHHHAHDSVDHAHAHTAAAASAAAAGGHAAPHKSYMGSGHGHHSHSFAAALGYPSEFEANLVMFLGGGAEDPAAAYADAFDSAEVWGWGDKVAAAHLGDDFAANAADASALPRLASGLAVAQLLKPTAAQTIFPCPRIGIGLEMSFAQLHSLVHMQAITAMHAQLP